MGVFHNRKSCEMVIAFGHNSADARNFDKKLNIKYLLIKKRSAGYCLHGDFQDVEDASFLFEYFNVIVQ